MALYSLADVVLDSYHAGGTLTVTLTLTLNLTLTLTLTLTRGEP